MPDLDLSTVLVSESGRFLDALRSTDLRTPVPSCPGWTAADLAWHLTEVQQFWGTIVAGLLDDPGRVQKIARPADEELLDLFVQHATLLVAAIATRSADDKCWSWHDDGHSVGWVLRRQAHEALVHRVDAELTAGQPVTPVHPLLGADGVDEILSVMIDPLPSWAQFEADGATALLEATDSTRSWWLAFGRFTGTSPTSGKTYDLDTASLGEAGAQPDAVIRAPAWHLDRWLWGRAGLDLVDVEGDLALAERLRALAADATA